MHLGTSGLSDVIYVSLPRHYLVLTLTLTLNVLMYNITHQEEGICFRVPQT